MNFSNTYACLNEVFYEKTRPTRVLDPHLFLWNSSLAEQLMIPDELKNDPVALAQVFSGNHIMPGSEPIATVYAGHQFGNFVPQLGDGRAHLLGEVLDRFGQRWDIQLKGSGPTLFSRGMDGRCAIGPAVREFIMSEAMSALGVPTTRCLAVVTTGEPVFRETPLPEAIVTRVASSHLRIGTFQFFAAQGDHQALKTLCSYTIERHYPELQEEGPNQYILFIDKVIERVIQLVVEWMRVGFIHGVMNTDNISISGETIDYGPCAMMGTYDPQTVYSSIDTMGRYAFGKQPGIAQWNIERFIECLLPLINADTNKAIDRVGPIITEFPNRFEQVYMKMIGKKLGLASFQQEDQKLIFSILDQLKKRRLDYTVTFDLLTKSLMSEAATSQMKSELGECFDFWKKRLNEQDATSQEVQELMRKHNPVVIPRNHHVEAVIQECEQTGDVTLVKKFLKVLRSPYEELEQTSQYQDLPSDGDKDYQTFCGT
ncbi:MAG: YdiU family protein [Candidatus Scalindua sp.]|nr:YdiU family protein [Candidatus Scalindua sp.]